MQAKIGETQTGSNPRLLREFKTLLGLIDRYLLHIEGCF
jgi:hypothetical protein